MEKDIGAIKVLWLWLSGCEETANDCVSDRVMMLSLESLGVLGNVLEPNPHPGDLDLANCTMELYRAYGAALRADCRTDQLSNLKMAVAAVNSGCRVMAGIIHDRDWRMSRASRSMAELFSLKAYLVQAYERVESSPLTAILSHCRADNPEPGSQQLDAPPTPEPSVMSQQGSVGITTGLLSASECGVHKNEVLSEKILNLWCHARDTKLRSDTLIKWPELEAATSNLHTRFSRVCEAASAKQRRVLLKSAIAAVDKCCQLLAAPDSWISRLSDTTPMAETLMAEALEIRARLVDAKAPAKKNKPKLSKARSPSILGHPVLSRLPTDHQLKHHQAVADIRWDRTRLFRVYDAPYRWIFRIRFFLSRCSFY